MAVTYTWTITDMERYSSTGGVFKVYWSCSGTQDSTTQTLTGTAEFTPDSSSADFVAYDALTEAIVLGWVHEGNYKTDMEHTVARMIDEADAEADKVTGKPWS